jgi:hypothetical protein
MTQDVTKQLAEVKAQVELAQAQHELSSLNVANKAIEYSNSVVAEGWGDTVDPRDHFYDGGNFKTGTSPAEYYETLPDDRNDGSFRPIFEDETDLNIIRAQANRVVWFDEIGMGALDSLKDYIYQDGLSFIVGPVVENTVPNKLVEEVGELVTHILRHNQYANYLDREYHDRARIDGEYLQYLEWKNGDAVWGEHEPQHLTEPDENYKRDLESWVGADYFESCWKYGVHTPKGKTVDRLGYHFVFDNEGLDWDYVPDERMVHYRRNVWRKVKRGISDFLVIVKDLERDAKLVENLALGTALQAAIAWITEYPEGAKNSNIQSAIAANPTFKRNIETETGTRQRSVNKYPPGSILHTPRGKKYVPGPLGSERSEYFIMVSQHLRRTTGVRFSLPEFMVSGDASNSNYSSTGQAADAFVKARESDQTCFGMPVVEALWKSIRMYANRGKLNLRGLEFDDVKRLVQITPDGQDPSTKSPLEKRQALAIETQHGWTSDETAATECGRQYRDETAKGAKRQASPNMQAEIQMSESVLEGIDWRSRPYG